MKHINTQPSKKKKKLRRFKKQWDAPEEYLSVKIN